MIIRNSGKILMRSWYMRTLRCAICGSGLKEGRFGSAYWTTAKNRSHLRSENVGPPIYICSVCEKGYDKKLVERLCKKIYLKWKQG